MAIALQVDEDLATSADVGEVLAAVAAHQLSTDAQLLALATSLAALATQIGDPAQAMTLATARDTILALVATRATPADVDVDVTVTAPEQVTGVLG